MLMEEVIALFINSFRDSLASKVADDEQLGKA